jgi:nucleotide-binding universal stress UspA family protein
MSKNHNSQFHALSKMLVPIDGSENANRALNFAFALAKTYGAEIIVLNVIPNPSIIVASSFGLRPTGIEPYYEEQEKASNHFVDEATELARKQNIPKITSDVVRADKSIVEEIIGYASAKKIDLIVIGTRGLGGFRRLVQGSVSSGVVSHAHCNVLVVR